MSQGVEGVRPGVALPVRVHDLLLSFAGRLDDDALADARQLLASAELDRALEFLGGCLVAGRVAITNAQRQELASLFSQVYLDPAMIDRLVVDDGAASTAVVRHRFGGGAIDGESAVQGVAEAARRVLDVLPDVRSVWAVWRLTPAGPASGPVPHRVVLVGVGPAGFAPATSYRLEYALRQAGIRASVEVLRDGAEAPEYHHAAMQYAAQVPFARQAPTNPSPVRPRMSMMEPAAPSMPPPSPALSTPISSLPSSTSSRPAPPKPPPAPPPPPPPGPPVAKVSDIAAPPAPEISTSSRRSRPEVPADPLASANPPVRPAPGRPGTWLSELPESTTPKPPPTNGKAIKPEPLPADDSLSDQEKLLLRQLQEELARREQEESEQAGHGHGRHGNGPAGGFDWPTSGGAPTVINGIPPQPPDQHR